MIGDERLKELEQMAQNNDMVVEQSLAFPECVEEIKALRKEKEELISLVSYRHDTVMKLSKLFNGASMALCIVSLEEILQKIKGEK